MCRSAFVNVCVTDILHALNDERVSWTQRVRLVRYAWISERVLLPNKKQILMNILINTVSASPRYNVDDTFCPHGRIVVSVQGYFLSLHVITSRDHPQISLLV